MREKILYLYQKNKKNLFPVMGTILYFVVVLYLVSCHENWRDEAQAWLICRDLSFTDMLKQLQYEGHPTLWYLLLFPLAKLGFPYQTMNLLSTLLVGSAVFLLLKKAPFHPILKILIITSMPFLYQYSVVARNYALIPISLVLLAIIYPKKNQYPYQYATLLMLLLNTHGLMLGMGIMLVIEWGISYFCLTKVQKNKHIMISILLVILMIGALINFYRIGFSQNSELNKTIQISNMAKNTLESFCGLFNTEFTTLLYKNAEKTILFTSAVVLFIVLLVYHKMQAMILLGSLAYQWILYSYAINASSHKVFTILCIIVFCNWLAMEENKDKKGKIKIILQIFLIILFGWASYLSVNSIKSDVLSNYSSAEEMADYLKDILKEDDEIIGISDAKISAILPYLNKKRAWSPITEKYYSFVTWNRDRKQKLSTEELIENIELKFQDNAYVYYIYAAGEDEGLKNKLKQEKILQPLYKTRASIKGEGFELYQIPI